MSLKPKELQSIVLSIYFYFIHSNEKIKKLKRSSSIFGTLLAKTIPTCVEDDDSVSSLLCRRIWICLGFGLHFDFIDVSYKDGFWLVPEKHHKHRPS